MWFHSHLYDIAKKLKRSCEDRKCKKTSVFPKVFDILTPADKDDPRANVIYDELSAADPTLLSMHPEVDYGKFKEECMTIIELGKQEGEREQEEYSMAQNIKRSDSKWTLE
jgi:hypothetical protein